MAPEIKLTIIDASGCTYSNILLCNELIPTPSVTPTVTPTISVTPTVTPTISVTPTVTPTISVTPTVTPTISVTPTVTPTITVTLTPTPSITPTSSPMALKAILFIEPLSGSSLIGQWMTDKGVDFYEEELSQDVKMNLVFVSHHNSCENTLKYLTDGKSKENVFNKQQLMNGEIVILPKSGILWSKEYSSVFTDDDFKVDKAETVKIVSDELIRIGNMENNDSIIKTAIQTFFNTIKSYQSNSATIKILQNKLSELNSQR
jgi:hypothetical protein